MWKHNYEGGLYHGTMEVLSGSVGGNRWKEWQQALIELILKLRMDKAPSYDEIKNENDQICEWGKETRIIEYV